MIRFSRVSSTRRVLSCEVLRGNISSAFFDCANWPIDAKVGIQHGGWGFNAFVCDSAYSYCKI